MDIKDIVGRANEALSSRKGFNFGMGKPETADTWSVGDVPEWIPSGVSILDRRLGGGLPVGRISELFSDHESEGKSTIALHFTANVQKAGGVAVWFDSESALDKPRAERMGVDLSSLVAWTPSSVEDGFVYINQIVKSISESKALPDKPTLIVWDTIAAAPSKAEKEGDAFAEGMAVKNRVISSALRQYVQDFFKYKVHLLLVNQSYTLLNKMGYGGPQYETPGGKAIKFYATARIKCKRIGFIGAGRDISGDDQRTGISVKITAVKNKLALPFQDSNLALFGETGYNDVVSMAHFFLDNKVTDALTMKSGGWYILPGGTKCQWAKLEQTVIENPQILQLWRDKVAEMIPLPDDREMCSDGWVRKKAGAKVRETDD